ncbi:hypothetical protein AgCh_006104 [Apium graveolens]
MPAGKNHIACSETIALISSARYGFLGLFKKDSSFPKWLEAIRVFLLVAENSFLFAATTRGCYRGTQLKESNPRDRAAKGACVVFIISFKRAGASKPPLEPFLRPPSPHHQSRKKGRLFNSCRLLRSNKLFVQEREATIWHQISGGVERAAARSGKTIKMGDHPSKMKILSIRGSLVIDRLEHVSSGAFFIFARRFDGGISGMRDGVHTAFYWEKSNHGNESTGLRTFTFTLFTLMGYTLQIAFQISIEGALCCRLPGLPFKAYNTSPSDLPAPGRCLDEIG